MKVKEKSKREMEEDPAATRFCKNCKREVAAANFSLHEAHCMRFLILCPKCDELIPSKEMKEHFTQAHKQVRCQLCHQLTQQYLLEHHQSEECPERTVRCQFCKLDLPHHKLQLHQYTCGSRTTSCWHCGKYIMYKALKDHKAVCQEKDRGRNSTENLCRHCQSWFPDEEYLHHLNECIPLPRLLGALTTHSSTEESGSPPSGCLPTPASPVLDKATEEQVVRPKQKVLSSAGRPSLKPPKGKKKVLAATLTSAAPETLEDSLFDTFGTCSRCNILLPSPTLQKHEKKCRRQTSVQALRRSSRLRGKEEKSM